MQSFVDYVRTEMLERMQQGFGQESAIVPMQRTVVVTRVATAPAHHAALKGLSSAKPRVGAAPTINAVPGGRRS